MAFVSSSDYAIASGGPASFIDYYDILLSFFVADPHLRGEIKPVLGALLSFIIITIIGLKYRRAALALQEDFAPDGRFSIRSIVENVMEFVYNLVSSIIGEGAVKPFLSLLSSLFIFIFVSNLIGLIPGFIPTTESISTNLTMALVVFITYNYAGIKEHGTHYIKQFLGPVVFLMPLMFLIETVAHLARPVSLSLRLLGNIFGDHLVLSVFTGLTYVILPSFLLFFGLLVASIQSFVFTLLSSIYISLAISHDH
jgi:F-type H+-transporting ATPase subunit a